MLAGIDEMLEVCRKESIDADQTRGETSSSRPPAHLSGGWPPDGTATCITVCRPPGFLPGWLPRPL
jgi:hypothetical protein